MPTRSKPATDTFYHIFNRGIEKRQIFMNDHDRTRFVHGLYFFNDISPSENLRRLTEVKLPSMDAREVLVEIHAFCLMDNHYHLLLRDVSEQGGQISEFMRKVGTGYTNYFNLKHERVGSLFQGTYKAVPVLEEEHLHYLLHYIHLNPVIDGSLTSNNRYRWSSYESYVNDDETTTSPFHGLVTTSFFMEILGGRDQIIQETTEFAGRKRGILLEKLAGLTEV